MSSLAAQRPAILGGSPVRPAGPPDWPITSTTIRDVFERLALSGDWGRYHGPNVPELSRKLGSYHNVEHVLFCSSGTAAVELALRGVGVKPDDEVILAGYDFKSNFQNVLTVSAVPVLVDLQSSNWQIDSSRIVDAISPRTRAVIMSHLHGGLAAAPAIRQIADANGIAVIEDACQNPGAAIDGRRVGTWGDVGVLSFGGSKLLTAGRGGALLTRGADIVERVKRYVLRGNDAYPLSEFQAAVLIPQLEQLDELNQRRTIAVRSLALLLETIGGLSVLQLPDECRHPVYYKVGLQYQPTRFGGLNRDLFATALRAEGFAIDPGFRGLHLIHASRRFKAADRLTEATRADEQMLMLHHPILLEGELGIEELVTAIQKVRQSADQIQALNPTG